MLLFIIKTHYQTNVVDRSTWGENRNPRAKKAQEEQGALEPV